MNPKAQTIAAIDYATMMRDEGVESISGPGSSLANTASIRKWLPALLLTYCVKSLIDLPCGDHHWMKQIELGDCGYLGLDVVPLSLDRAEAARPDRMFQQWNAIDQTPPRADLILCRDFIVHLSMENAMKVMANLRASGARYLLATTFPEVQVNTELPESHPGWGWRKLNMQLSPFDMGFPLATINEDEGEGKCLTLFQF